MAPPGGNRVNPRAESREKARRHSLQIYQLPSTASALGPRLHTGHTFSPIPTYYLDLDPPWRPSPTLHLMCVSHLFFLFTTAGPLLIALCS